MAGPQGFRQRLQPRSQQAQINRFNTQVSQDPNFTKDHWYQARSPAGNQYDNRDFTISDQRMTHGVRQTGGSHREEELRANLFGNSYRTNPNTGQKIGHSMSISQGPSGEWIENRLIYPDASGFGQRKDSEGNYSEYPIQLKGPQTWHYDPGNTWNLENWLSKGDSGKSEPAPGIMGLEMADATDYMNKMKEGYKKIDPYLPDVDWQNKSIGHEWNKPLWGGNLGIGGEYDVDDDEYNVGINWGTAFG